MLLRRRELIAAAAVAPGSLLLAQARRTPYTICLARDASLSERRAADELAHHVELMCGAQLPIVTEDARPAGPLILVGRSETLERRGFRIPFERLGAEGFALQTRGGDVAVAGGRQRGTMYGVYELLERLGCRWYALDQTVTPRRETLRIPPLDEIQQPSFESRDVLIWEATRKDWAARNRLNGNFTECDASTGGKVLFEPFVHSFYALVPQAKYFGPHPEYYALVNGERRAERAQLCLTNAEVIRIASETAIAWIEAKPEAAIISVSVNDADGPCECAACRRVEQEEGGAHSGPMLRFVNAVAAEVARKHPDKLVETLAYRHTEAPPAKVRPAPNVRVRLALSGPCQAHPYEQCPHNRYAMDFLRSWARVSDRLYIWHYMTHFRQALEPYPNLDELLADVAMYRRHNVVGLFLQGSYAKGGGLGLADLRSWVLAKLLWNCDRPGEPLLDEFIRAHYGAAAPAMRGYLDLMNREVRFPPRGMGKSIYMYAGPAWAPDFLERARGLMAQASAAVAAPLDSPPLDSPMARRIRKVKLTVESVDVFASMRLRLFEDRLGPADLEGFWKKYERFSAEATALGITEWYEAVPRETSEREYRQYIRNYDIATVANGSIRVVAAPEFGGRVVSIQKIGAGGKAGANALRMMEPDERLSGAENLGGLYVIAHPEFYAREVYRLDWKLKACDGRRRMVLEGRCAANGLRVERTLEIEGNVLHTRTTARNSAGGKALPVTLQSRFEVNPGDREHPTVDFLFRARNGESRGRTRILPVNGGQNYGDDFFRDDGRPAGEWGLLNSAAEVAVVNRFRDDQVERCRFWWRGRSRNTVALGSWSPRRNLAPGEEFTFETDYVVE
jgi:hypothetical protein